MKTLIKLFALLGVIATLVVTAIGFHFYSFKNTPMNINEEQVVVVKPGASLSQIAHDLAAKGIVDYPRYLSWWGRIDGTASRIHVGEYQLMPGATPQQFLQQMARGDVIQYSVTLIEGWNYRQVLQVLHENEKLKPTLAGKTEQEIAAAIGIESGHPEGWFFPDTYHFPAGMTDVEFLKRAYRAMQKRLELEWQNKAEGLPYKNAYEALIMASIIEKETGVPSERSEIAGVFVRRLEKKMRLQTDPTVIYGIGEKFDGNIRRRDLRKDTPYNTYTRHGLTPTPIAMPSGEAIHAALHPADGKSLYFVAKGDGSHYFSETIREHINAVRKYQLKKK